MLRCVTRLHLRGTATTLRMSGIRRAFTTNNDNPSEEEQMTALVHYCRGLRESLNAHAGASLVHAAPLMLDQLRHVHATSPFINRRNPGFWSSMFFTAAFQYEMSALHDNRAQSGLTDKAVVTFLTDFVKLSMTLAEAELMGFDDPYLLATVFGIEYPNEMRPPAPKSASDVTPWHLFGTESVETACQNVATRMLTDGIGVTHTTLGPVVSRAVRDQALAYIHAEGLQPGEMDLTGRSNTSLRDDHICWLQDHSLAGYPLLAAMAQLLRTRIQGGLARYLTTVPLRPPRTYNAAVMLARYASASRGFVRHTDKASADDPRCVSLVYYLNDDWMPEYGGSLVCEKRGGGEAVVTPSLDTLVGFMSDQPHEVRAMADNAPERLALSYWCLSGDST